MQLVQERFPSLKNRDEEDFVGLHYPFGSPIHLYLNKNDLQSGSNQVYFYVYSAGKKMFIVWGYYDRTKASFKINDGCKYRVKDLMSYIKKWKNGYLFAIQAVKNRISSRMDEFLYGDLGPLETFQDYITILEHLEGNLSGELMEFKDDELRKIVDRYEGKLIAIRDDYKFLKQYLVNGQDSVFYNPLAPVFDIPPLFLRKIHRKFKQQYQEMNSVEYPFEIEQEITSELDAAVQDYEKKLNKLEHATNDQEVMKISELFYDFVSSGKIMSDTRYKNLNQCKTVEECELAWQDGCEIVDLKGGFDVR